eukprot:499512_1
MNYNTTHYNTGRVKRDYIPSQISVKQRIQNGKKYSKTLKHNTLNKRKQIRNWSTNNWSDNKVIGFNKRQRKKQNQMYLTRCGVSVKLNNRLNHKPHNKNKNNFITKMHNRINNGINNNKMNNNHTTYNKNQFQTKNNKRYAQKIKKRNLKNKNNTRNYNRNGFNNNSKPITKTIQTRPKSARRTNMQFSIDNVNINEQKMNDYYVCNNENNN